MTENQTIHEKIAGLEKQYTELKLNLDIKQKELHKCEHDLLECLQELMPLQNTYLKNIINTLQKQNQQPSQTQQKSQQSSSQEDQS